MREISSPIMETKTKNSWQFIVAAGIFALCLVIGYHLSLRRPLWNDEIHSQVNVIDAKSYQDIIFFRIRNLEGNACPLFYLIQKGISDLFQYRFPLTWQHEWGIRQ